ncbi:MAG: hypothetical protein ACFFFK_00060 [Candidatus Thorarchaeota archaeon]
MPDSDLPVIVIIIVPIIFVVVIPYIFIIEVHRCHLTTMSNESRVKDV